MNNIAPRYLSLDGSLPTGTLPEYAILNKPIKIIMHGPAINPNRCPTALEGEFGTVHGLARTKNNPDSDNKVPIFLI